jgi:hypothetical protein
MKKKPIRRLSLAAPVAAPSIRFHTLLCVLPELGGAPLGLNQIEASRPHLRDAIMPEEPIKPPRRLRMIWPAFAVGVGLLGVLVWTLFLGWLLGHVLLAIF